jgi:phosphoglycolate phosphatase-like HAD superfamily hydrolase
MPDVLLLDIDGTLVDSTYHHAMCWHAAFTRLGHDLTVNRLHRLIGMGGDRLVAAAAGQEVEDRDGDALRDAWAEEYAEMADDVRPVPGAADTLRRMADAGYVLALPSSGERKFAEKAVQSLGVEDLVTVLTTSTDAEESKPDPELVETTLAKVREDHEVGRALLVGDTPYDVEAAERAGIPCVAVLTGGFDEAELGGAAVVLGDVTDLTPELVEKVLSPGR